jgi:hypothetical protein
MRTCPEKWGRVVALYEPNNRYNTTWDNMNNENSITLSNFLTLLLSLQPTHHVSIQKGYIQNIPDWRCTNNKNNKRVWKLPTSNQLCATWHTDSLDMLVLPPTGASCCSKCCIDGGASLEYFGYPLVHYHDSQGNYTCESMNIPTCFLTSMTPSCKMVLNLKDSDNYQTTYLPIQLLNPSLHGTDVFLTS